ncbi:MAG: hypothetical protein E4H31_01010 [Dehalococcoidia bacterium]|nr:MAG: hypothetical protein E4H31_01010 [Dehalococcoidia bacterium]
MDNGNYIAFHILVELVTAGLIVATGVVILFQEFHRLKHVFLATGTLLYVSINSLAWSTSNDKRLSAIFIFIIIIAL